MTALEHHWAEQILSAFAPLKADGDGRGLAPKAGEVDWLGTLELLRRRSTWLAALGLRAAIWLVALAPVWQLRRLTSVGALAPEERAAYLASLLSHRSFVVRELTLLLKLCASLALFANDAVRARSGYDRAQARPLALRAKGAREAKAPAPSSVPPPPTVEALTH
jgi:hypothetical protein